ncbi:MAG: bifunctional DNA-formamidopyrimidine glycosylase/DNA-(apurinic or apyrimidinic site) lyase, partial [Pseudomonadota bacterium]
RLRWPVPEAVQQAVGARVTGLHRRAKYLLIETDAGGDLMVHLGMSGSLRVITDGAGLRPHDHFDLVTRNAVIRYNDPRRFGALLWVPPPRLAHPLLSGLGPEPLGDAFDGQHLYALSRGRRLAVKSFIMDAKVVVGVGNIYASEALFMAGIHPTRPAGRIARHRYEALAQAIRDVLSRSIAQGGTTLRDYVNSDGAPGYFALDLLAYGRAGEPCFQCGAPLRQKVIGQRSSFYCVNCQR